MYREFEKRDTVVIAVAQEDKDLKSHGRMLSAFGGKPPFDVVADLDREKTQSYDRTTSYLIDKRGIVREIFPALIHTRPTWKAVLNRIDALNADRDAAAPE
jgi:alkyl hydroperoxide reductase subunit AhpC